jgi:hypothetical protein
VVTVSPMYQAPVGTICGPSGPATGYAWMVSDGVGVCALDFVAVSLKGGGNQSLPSLFAALKFGKGGM